MKDYKHTNNNDPEPIESILSRVVPTILKEPPFVANAVRILRMRRAWSVAELALHSGLPEFLIQVIELGEPMDAGQRYALWRGFNQYFKWRHRNESRILQASFWRVRLPNRDPVITVWPAKVFCSR